MAKTITKYTIFLASPGELDYERNEIDKFIKEINLSFGNTNDIHIEIKKWETDSAPGITKQYTQDIINKDIGDDYDIFVGILWKKFGSPTPNARSGTEEEFNRAVERFKKGENIQVLFYFKNEGVQNINEIDPVELIKINAFKNSLSPLGVFYSEFTSIEDLGNQLRLHIPKRILELLRNTTNENNVLQNTSQSKEIESYEKNEPNELELGYFDYMVEFQTFLWSSNSALTSIDLSTRDVGKKLNERSVEINNLNQSGNVNPQNYLTQFKMVSKILLEYVEKLKLDTNSFYENFELAIKTGLKFVNTYSHFDNLEENQYLQEIHESSGILKDNIPKGIEGMKSFRNTIKKLPKIQSDLNFAAKILEKQLDNLIEKLTSSYKLTIEFMTEIDLKLNIK